MWNGKNKALTFSYDDGVIQDYKLIENLEVQLWKRTENII